MTPAKCGASLSAQAAQSDPAADKDHLEAQVPALDAGGLNAVAPEHNNHGQNNVHDAESHNAVAHEIATYIRCVRASNDVFDTVNDTDLHLRRQKLMFSSSMISERSSMCELKNNWSIALK